jgi:hypothetical protein
LSFIFCLFFLSHASKHVERPIFVNTQDTQMVPHLLTGAGWMKGETQYFREAVQPGMTVVEVRRVVGWL